MRKYLLLLLILMVNEVFSQKNIGVPISSIKKKYKESKYQLKQNKEDNGTITIDIRLQNAAATYTFDNSKLSTMLVITPFDRKSLNKYISEYDSKYKRLNSETTKWEVETKYSEEVSIVEHIILSQITAKNGEIWYNLIWVFE
ncbi:MULTISPECIES: hypothetical protein [unclassified Flavobacterium]|uniref:hypothetical protein n=1 Tax=unclassified Flavobacterium TaxID=196869 RepID=UPI00131C3EC1|nr:MULTISPECIES: hypothetical protein [unclassified Flavobacterium]